jgi:hypothetical protein
MAYVPGCRYDIFISYATENNHDGWVEQFVNTLGQELADLLGRQFSPKDCIFYDKRQLEVAESFPETLSSAARDAAILIPVLSPGYLTSWWCNQERVQFFSKLPDGALPSSCLAPILIRPIDETGLIDLYRRAQNASFISADNQSPLSPSSADWLRLLRSFASGVKKALEGLRRSCKPVFLGKTPITDRGQKLRVWCQQELANRHFRTAPDSLQALDDSDGIRAALQDAGLAVHFLGGADAIALEAVETSVPLCKGPTILYQPYGTALLPDESLWLEDFERQLQTSSAHYQRLAQKPDQELLALIDEQITRVRPDHSRQTRELQLAWVCDESDLESVRQMQAEVKAACQVEAALPSFLGRGLRSMEKVRNWKDYINRGKAFLFYCGVVGRERLEPIWQMAEKEKPNSRRSWVLAPPDIATKRQNYPEALLDINQVIGFIESARGAA